MDLLTSSTSPFFSAPLAFGFGKVLEETIFPVPGERNPFPSLFTTQNPPSDQEVDVIIVPQRPPAVERLAAWRTLADEIQAFPNSKEITKEEVLKEIDDYRAGR
jgi:hypothetical protein